MRDFKIIRVTNLGKKLNSALSVIFRWKFLADYAGFQNYSGFEKFENIYKYI